MRIVMRPSIALALLTAVLTGACSSPRVQSPPLRQQAAFSASPIPPATVSIPLPSPSATNIRAPSTLSTPSAVEWTGYSDEELGFAFEYPAAYGDPSWPSCPFEAIKGTDISIINSGYATSLWVIQTAPSPPDEYVSARLATLSSSAGFKLLSQTSLTVGGLPALQIRYMLLDPLAYRVETVLARDGQLYLFTIWDIEGCNWPERGIYELDAYERMLSTFHFIP
jgi:hypothetical protein